MFKVWRNITPFASDNVGAASAFANTRGLMIFNDMNGSIACAERFLKLFNVPCFYCSSLHQIRDNDYLDPDPERFLAEYIEVIDACNPDFVVLLYGPVSSQVELNLKELANLLEERKGITTLAVPTPLDQDYSYGIESSFEAIYERLKPLMIAKRDAHNEKVSLAGTQVGDDPKHLGLLGLDLYDYAGMQNCLTMLPFFQSAWGCAPSLDDHARIAEADKTVVMSLSGLRIARRVKAELGIDFALLDECDVVRKAVPHLRDMRCRLADVLDDMYPEKVVMPWMRGPEDEKEISLRILIVGDQIIAHAAAKSVEDVIEERRTPFAKEISYDFDYALPFGMDEDIALESDYPIETEVELLDAVSCPEYDVVIAPSSLEDFANDSIFITLENLAVRKE